MDRTNHYETAFEAYLQEQRLGYIAVDETRRALLGNGSLKSLDFIVHGAAEARLLVDVKGRRFPAGPDHRPRNVWECWSTLDDVRSLESWCRLFGPGYQGLLVFMYHIADNLELPGYEADFWIWQDRRYLLYAVDVDDYRAHMKVRSRKWATVGLNGSVYRRLAQPFRAFTDLPAVSAEWNDFEPAVEFDLTH